MAGNAGHGPHTNRATPNATQRKTTTPSRMIRITEHDRAADAMSAGLLAAPESSGRSSGSVTSVERDERRLRPPLPVCSPHERYAKRG